MAKDAKPFAKCQHYSLNIRTPGTQEAPGFQFLVWDSDNLTDFCYFRLQSWDADAPLCRQILGVLNDKRYPTTDFYVLLGDPDYPNLITGVRRTKPPTAKKPG
jgi:hypothetical protein